jgi:two-component system response regulator HydG
VPVDIRVLSATHRDLAAMVETGRFRMDLFYRLNVVRIEVPPLRQRMEDVPLLVQHFLDEARRAGSPVEGLADDALGRLLEHDWPGNVRELENVIESAVALARGPWLRAADLPLGRNRRAPSAAPAPPREGVDPGLGGLPLSLDAYERSALERALRESGGNATDAARRLGIGRSTFYRKLGKHGLRAPGFPDPS